MAHVACWRIKGDSASRLATGDWIDGAPDTETLKEYAQLGWVIEYAYTLDDAELAALANVGSAS